MSMNPECHPPLRPTWAPGEGSHNLPDDQSSHKDSLDGATIGPDHGESSPTKNMLHRRGSTLFIVVFYALVALYSWVVFTILARQPVGAGWRMQLTKRLYQSVKFLGGVAGVSALPVATAVCARAVVAYDQKRRNGITLRQTKLLADHKRMGGLTDFFPLLQLTAPCSGERCSGAAIAAVGCSRFMGTGHSLASLDPGKSFVSPAFTTFNTGLLRQFTPRLNSTVSFSVVPAREFPKDSSRRACHQTKTKPPWKDEFRTPQRISEVLNLKIDILTGDADEFCDENRPNQGDN
ncbi:hypothetical protein PAAG_12529 [Paracoccidioides lutzii Pb01]|uniref:Transmembrane protein n=1 Tax=Paracoccidioides lutzii (strain ATCC MYA-826 / Pb01) TaxID=502779 RepID=A0A0A2UZ02_PARBA|nr:hypothetical protein PAAG_12529 [Paracoccidioides lutzii Pb01]KGQ00801.1 hypothetical protein PAAG_12529 [Paracoccidioides lutzii Pb01]